MRGITGEATIKRGIGIERNPKRPEYIKITAEMAVDCNPEQIAELTKIVDDAVVKMKEKAEGFEPSAGINDF